MGRKPLPPAVMRASGNPGDAATTPLNRCRLTVCSLPTASVAQVEDQLESAANVFRTLPGAMPRGSFIAWPEYFHSFADKVVQEQQMRRPGRVRARSPNRRRRCSGSTSQLQRKSGFRPTCRVLRPRTPWTWPSAYLLGAWHQSRRRKSTAGIRIGRNCLAPEWKNLSQEAIYAVRDPEGAGCVN